MFLELIATFVAGIAAAGGIMLLNKVVRGRLPRWLTPVVAGLAMLAATISSEYGWFDRTANNMPDGFEVAKKVEDRAFYRPWTYAFPYVSRFMAVDTLSIRTNDAFEGQHMVEVAFFGRWAPVQLVPMLIDCPTAQQAELGGAEFGADGGIENANWAPLATDDGLYKIVCGGTA